MNFYNLKLAKLTDGMMHLLTNSDSTREITVRRHGGLLATRQRAMAEFPEVFTGAFDAYYINIYEGAKADSIDSRDSRDSARVQFFFKQVR